MVNRRQISRKICLTISHFTSFLPPAEPNVGNITIQVVLAVSCVPLLGVTSFIPRRFIPRC